MTNAEAIGILRKHDLWPLWSVEAHDAIDMAILALEKQVGKKPEEAGLMGVHIPACANCKNLLMFITERARSEFCPKCGLRIDWSGIDWSDTDEI